MTNSENTTFTVYMYKQEKEYLEWLVLQRPKIETGGDLFGLWQSPDTVMVQLITGPGKHCSRTETSFFQDISYLTTTGQELTSCQGLCNIGEWHSHHRIGLASPSEGDQNTVWKHMQAESGGRFLLFIASISGSNKHPSVKIGCFMFSSKTRTMSQGSLEPVPGRSPIRTRFNDVDFKPGPEEGMDWDYFMKAVKGGHQQQLNNNSAEGRSHPKSPKENTQSQEPSTPREKERRPTERTKLISYTPSYGSADQPKKQTKHSQQTTSTPRRIISKQPDSRLRDVVSPAPNSSSNSKKEYSSTFCCCYCYKCN